MAQKVRTAEFPTRQMAILAVCRFAEPVAATSVNPYIPEMVASFNVATDKIGMYSGWLAAVFSLSQAVTGVAWGRASDRLGRKPMILLALMSVMIGTVLFGFSTSLAMAFISRSIQGASSGNVGIIRTTVAEIVPQKELQPLAFSIMPLVWNIGSIFGPPIGGFLSNPQRHGWFLHSPLLHNYPFALPNITIAILFLVGITIGILFLKESLESQKHRKDYGLLFGSLLTSSCSRRPKRDWGREDEFDETEPFLDENDRTATSLVASKSPRPSAAKPPTQHTWSEVFSRQSIINLVAYTGLATHSVAFDQLLPVFMHHPVQSHKSSGFRPPLRFSGGFELESGRIGVLFTIYGVFGMLVQLFLFPPLARKYGVLNCLKVCAITFPVVYLTIPFTSLLSTNGLRQGVCVILMLFKCAAGIFAFPCSTILLTNSASSLSVLGTLNGVATSVSATGRAIGPALTGWAFTLGVDAGYVVVPFWFLFVLSVVAAIPVWSLIEMEGFGSKPPADEDADTRINSDDEQERFQMHPTNSHAKSADTPAGLGILTGTETVDLLDDDIPVITQKESLSKPSNGLIRRNSGHALTNTL